MKPNMDTLLKTEEKLDMHISDFFFDVLTFMEIAVSFAKEEELIKTGSYITELGLYTDNISEELTEEFVQVNLLLLSLEDIVQK